MNKILPKTLSRYLAVQAAYNLIESKIALLKITGGIIQEFNK